MSSHHLLQWMALPEIRGVPVTAQPLLSAARWWLRLHRSGLRAVLDLHRDGLHPRWVLPMLFLRRHRYLEGAAEPALRREEKESTAARCWPIMWSHPHPQWVVALQTEWAPGTVTVALAAPRKWAHPPRRHTPVARARMLEQLSLLSPAPKLECPRAAVQVRSRCHPAAARSQGWAGRVEAPQFRAELAPAAALAGTARAEPTPEPDVGPTLSPVSESLPPTAPVVQAILQQATLQCEVWRLAAAATS